MYGYNVVSAPKEEYYLIAFIFLFIGAVYVKTVTLFSDKKEFIHKYEKFLTLALKE